MILRFSTYKIYLLLILFFIVFTFNCSLYADKLPSYELKADLITYDHQQNKVQATNGFIFAIDDLLVMGQEVSIDLVEGLIRARGEVILKIRKEKIKGEYLEYNYLEKEGYFVSAESKINNLNFAGGRIDLVSDKNYNLQVKDAMFTTCQLENPHYHLQAKKMTIYEDNRILAENVTLYWGDIPVLYLPTYLLEYVEKDGKAEIESYFPVPNIGYDSESGLKVDVNYSYGYHGLQGKAILNYEQNGEKTVKNKLKYRWPDFAINGFFSLDLKDYSRKEGLGLDYYLTDTMTLHFEKEWEMENPDRYRVTLYYDENNLNAQLHYRRGYNLDYLPYLQLKTPLYSSNLLKVNTQLEAGRVKEGQKEVDKAKYILTGNYQYSLFPELTFNVSSTYQKHFYFRPESSNYQSIHFNLDGDYKINLTQSLSTDLSLGYNYKAGQGKALLSADKVSSGSTLEPGVKIKYNLQEFGSNWELGIQSAYNLNNKELKKINLKAVRNFDCYSYFVSYDLLEKTYGFGIDF